MTSEGPTTTGSIDAKLTVDDSDFKRGMAEAKVEAKEVGALEPTVKVDANVGAALAKLEAIMQAHNRIVSATSTLRGVVIASSRDEVEASQAAGRAALLAANEKSKAAEKAAIAAHEEEVAQRKANEEVAASALAAEEAKAASDKLWDSNRKAAIQADLAALGEGKIAAARHASVSAAARVKIAEADLAELRKREGDDSLTLAHSVEQVASAHRAAALATQRLKAAEEEETATKDRSTQANQRNVSGIAVLVGMAPAILAASAPIVAGAVGLAAAFGVMGVSGVLAIKGIKDAMVVGDTVGNTYAAGIGILKTNLDQLAGSAATGMLQGFSRVVYDINTQMPYLTTITGQFSGLLGQIGGTALQGVLNGLRTMNPLLQAGGVELGNFVTWLFSFNNTAGFNDFIQYAVQNLPSVMHLIESLVTLAGHLLEAFAPLGPVVISVLTAISDGLNGLPLPILAGLTTAAVAVAPALRIAGAAMALFSIESQLAVPVVGLVTAALTGIGIAAATAALGTDQGTQSFQDYTKALKDDNEALGEHVRLQAAKALSDAGAYDAARTLGVSQTALTDALMGVAGAQDTVNAAIKRGREFQNDWSQGTVDTMSGAYLATDAQNKMGKAIDTVTKTLDTQRTSMDRGKQINQDMAAATNSQTLALQAQAAQYGVTVSQYQSVTDAQTKTAQATADTTAKMQLQNDAAGLLKAALDGLNGKAISAAQAQNAFDSSLVNMGDHVTTTGKKITFTTTSINDMSSASVALRGQLNTQVTGLQNVIEANGGLSNSTAAAKAQYATMRDQIIANAVAHGVDKDAVTAYIDKLLAVPASIPPTRLDVDNAAAAQKIADIQWRLDQLQTHKQIFIDVQQSTSNVDNTGTAGGAQPKLYAKGGMVNYLASGGAPRFVPQGSDTVPAMLTPGEIVMNRASVQALGAGNLLHANKTGQWPGQGQQQVPAPMVNVYVGNEQLDARMYTVAQGAIGSAGRDAGRRPAR